MDLFKKQLQIPDKKTMNLYRDQSQRKEIPDFVVGVIIVVVIVLILSGFVLTSRLNKMLSLESEVEALNTQYVNYVNYIGEYQKLKNEHLRYSDSFIGEDNELSNRMEILDLLNEAMEDHGIIKSMEIEGNQVSLKVVTSTLNDLNVIRGRLEENDSVVNIRVNEADNGNDGLTSSIVFEMTIGEEDDEK